MKEPDLILLFLKRILPWNTSPSLKSDGRIKMAIYFIHPQLGDPVHFGVMKTWVKAHGKADERRVLIVGDICFHRNQIGNLTQPTV